MLLGVNFMEKTISIRNTEITFSIWDLGGQREFVNMLPLVCNDAVAILFMFDLTRKSTLNSIKEWYRQGRGFNKTAIPFLVGTKYDHFINFPKEDQEEISNQVSDCPRARLLQADVCIGSSLRESHASKSDIQQHKSQHQCSKGTWLSIFGYDHLMLNLMGQIFKIVLSKAFDLKCTIPEIENIGEPLLLYQSVV